jgi:hypothetical protein
MMIDGEDLLLLYRVQLAVLERVSVGHEDLKAALRVRIANLERAQREITVAGDRSVPSEQMDLTWSCATCGAQGHGMVNSEYPTPGFDNIARRHRQVSPQCESSRLQLERVE